MKSFIQDGDKIDYANAGSAIASGDVVPLGGRIGVAAVVIAATTGVGAVEVEGVYRLAKHTGETFAQGDRLYWDNSNKWLTKVPGAAFYIAGTAWSAQASGDVLADVLLESEAAVPQMLVQAASTASDVAGLVVDFNLLLGKLKAAGLMASS